MVEEQPYLWAALRERVEPALAYVRGAGPDDLPRVWATCEPWPWLVAGATPHLPAGLVDLLDGHPIAVHWVEPAPPDLPDGVVRHGDWVGLLGAIDALAGLSARGVGGVRLLRNRGVQAPDGRIVLDVPAVEGLLAAPDGLRLPNGAAERVAAEIAANHLPVRLERHGDSLRLA